MDVLEAIRNRRVVREYADKPIEKEKMDAILEAGRLAPTAKNQQKNKVIVVTEPELRKQMVGACKNQSFVGEAPAILVVCANEDRTMICGQSARSMDCAIAMSFMRLEAAELGLQGCWLGWYDPDDVRALLNIPDDYVVVAVCPIGYPARDGKSSVKKPMDEFAIYDRM